MINVYTGSNVYLINESVRSDTEEFKRVSGDSVEHFDGNEIINNDDLIDAVRSISFLEPRKMVIVKSFGQNKDLINDIESIVEQVADSTDLILVDEKLDKRTSAFKYLQKNTDMKVFGELAPYELENWIVAEAEKNDSEISRNEAKHLIERVGVDQLRLKNEINKLVLSGEKIDKDLIDEMVDLKPQSKVFSMLDELFKGRANSAWRLYEDQRLQGEEPQKIIGMITWQLQQLAYAVFAPVKSTSALVEVGVSPYSAGKVLQQAKNISKKDLAYYTKQLAEIDSLSKTSADVESALAVYFSDVSSSQKTT